MIVFEQTEKTENDTLELLVLEAVHGVSTERTDMMFRFRPLKVLSTAPQLHVRRVDGGKFYTEELSLEGGLMAPAAS